MGDRSTQEGQQDNDITGPPWRRVILVILVVVLVLIASMFVWYSNRRTTPETETFPSSVETVFVRELSFNSLGGVVEYEREIPVPFDIQGRAGG